LKLYDYVSVIDEVNSKNWTEYYQNKALQDGKKVQNTFNFNGAGNDLIEYLFFLKCSVIEPDIVYNIDIA
jgi:hypothetical protein